MQKGAPITPDEMPAAKRAAIPGEVFDVWNAVIVEHWSRTPGRAHILQKDIVQALCDKLKVDRRKVYDSGWLNIEDDFRQSGWHVEYDKPAYCESYEANFTFTKKK